MLLVFHQITRDLASAVLQIDGIIILRALVDAKGCRGKHNTTCFNQLILQPWDPRKYDDRTAA